MSNLPTISGLTAQALTFSLDCADCDYSLKRHHVDDGGMLEVSIPGRRENRDGKLVVFDEALSVNTVSDGGITFNR